LPRRFETYVRYIGHMLRGRKRGRGPIVHLSMWTYPWDVLDLGQEAVEGDLRDRAGLDAISLATSYHAGHFFQPRSPVRKSYFPEDGVVYFQPDSTRWNGRRIVPKQAELVSEGGDVLRSLVRRRDAGGLKVHCWTVCLHNTRLGMLHPGTCTRNAYGDPNYFALCPSNQDARAYVTTLVADISHNYRPDCVELETTNFMAFVHDHHHEKDGVGLGREGDFLMSLCFCDSCLDRARCAGVDGEAARRTVRRLIAELSERAIPSPRWPDLASRGLAALGDVPEVEAYARWRTEPVTSLATEVREAGHPDCKIIILEDVDPLFSALDLAESSKRCDGGLVAVYGMLPPAITASVGALSKALRPDRFVAAGMRIFSPEISGGADLAERARAAVDAGAQGIGFYNYGLIPAARLDWVGEASRAAREAEATRPAAT
jgi:hypothetical protein